MTKLQRNKPLLFTFLLVNFLVGILGFLFLLALIRGIELAISVESLLTGTIFLTLFYEFTKRYENRGRKSLIKEFIYLTTYAIVVYLILMLNGLTYTLFTLFLGAVFLYIFDVYYISRIV